MSDTGSAELEAMTARIRSLGTLARDVARASVPEVEKAARKTAAAGTDPEGKAWAPRKSDGGRALANAAEAVTARAIGTVVQISLAAIETYHQRSKSHARRVIPDGKGLPAAIAKAIDDTARKIFDAKMGGHK